MRKWKLKPLSSIIQGDVCSPDMLVLRSNGNVDCRVWFVPLPEQWPEKRTHHILHFWEWCGLLSLQSFLEFGEFGYWVIHVPHSTIQLIICISPSLSAIFFAILPLTTLRHLSPLTSFTAFYKNRSWDLSTTPARRTEGCCEPGEEKRCFQARAAIYWTYSSLNAHMDMGSIFIMSIY